MRHILGKYSSFRYPRIHTITGFDIDAPPKVVYEILADISQYPAWNPYFVEIKGDSVEGAPLEVHIKKPNGQRATATPRMMALKPCQEIRWGGGIRGLFYGEHAYLISETVCSGTHVICQEHFEGIALPFAQMEAREEGDCLLGEALKARVKHLARN